MRCVLPKIDLETGRDEYSGALGELMASFGLSAAPAQTLMGVETTPQGKVKAKGEVEGKWNALTDGAQY